MEHVLWIALVVMLCVIVAILLTGVVIFIRGGELNRRYGNLFMNLRTGSQAVAILLLGILLLLHQHFK